MINFSTFSQSEGLTNSPYSLYGLGTINQTTLGKYNSMGYTGIGQKSTTDINNLNAANFALIQKGTFLYDVGLRGNYNTYENYNDLESKTYFNFSNLAFAFPLGDKGGMGITLLPYTDVGYTLIGKQNNIEGSTDTYESNVDGLGGLTDFKLNFGYALLPSLRLGVSASLLFGNIEQTESFSLESSAFTQEKSTNYSGFKIGTGLQWDITKNTTLGSTINFPVNLNGNQITNTIKIVDNAEVAVQEDEKSKVDGFTLPMELGLGISSVFKNYWTLNVDYKKNYWEQTNQSEFLGSYIDQDVFGVGLTYKKEGRNLNYGQRIAFRTGYTYDTGNLRVGGNSINGQQFTFGIGLPTSYRSGSMVNLSYAYGTRGKIDNSLIKENYHMLTLNLSLLDNWFLRRKIN